MDLRRRLETATPAERSYESFEKQVQLDIALRAFADPVRRHTLDLLRHDGATAGDLAASAHSMFGISRPRVSQHLQVLAHADLVDVNADETWRHYRFRHGSANVVTEWIATLGGP